MAIKNFCSECAAGEIYDEPAIYLVTGHDVRTDMPFKKMVCEDHCNMLYDDDSIKSCKEITQPRS